MKSFEVRDLSVSGKPLVEDGLVTDGKFSDTSIYMCSVSAAEGQQKWTRLCVGDTTEGDHFSQGVRDPLRVSVKRIS